MKNLRALFVLVLTLLSACVPPRQVTLVNVSANDVECVVWWHDGQPNDTYDLGRLNIGKETAFTLGQVEIRHEQAGYEQGEVRDSSITIDCSPYVECDEGECIENPVSSKHMQLQPAECGVLGGGAEPLRIDCKTLEDEMSERELQSNTPNRPR